MSLLALEIVNPLNFILGLFKCFLNPLCLPPVLTRRTLRWNPLFKPYSVSSHGSLASFCGQLSDRFFSILRTLSGPFPLPLPLTLKHSLLLAVCISALLAWHGEAVHSFSILTWD